VPAKKSAAKKSASAPAPESSASAAATAVAAGAGPKGDPGKGRVFLIDTMSFIFRAYHAMARQRPMSTKTGIPTSATYVFVNMLRKLVADFHPEYIAAVFDVAGPTFRDQSAAAVTSVRKWDIKTQQFQEVAYDGYKAQRAEMPADLSQQVPYIRRALDAYRIPILQIEGFEADDLIGALATQAAKAGHPVFVVSSDKDMLQLVNDHICVLNPPKDNLICDAAKVEEILGVPPSQVIDVMALRGDSIDNIPGAPGIGDKGSVELIRRFGSVEAALDHAEEVEKKTYRESLLNNRDTVLWSKHMVTIDCNAPIRLDLDTMVAREADTEAARALFTELEFTSLIKEYLPSQMEVGAVEYREAQSEDELVDVARNIASDSALAIAFQIANPAAARAETPEEDEGDSATLPLLMAIETTTPSVEAVAISTSAGTATALKLASDTLGAKLKSLLENERPAKAIHDYKAAIHALEPAGVTLAGVRDESMLYSYLLDPTYSSHTLPEVALRRFNLKLSGSVAEAADVTGRIASALRDEIATAGLTPVYDTIDLPLIPVLARMETAGVKIDCDVLAEMSKRLDREASIKAREIYDRAGEEFNISSPKQLGRILFETLNLPKPVKYGKGKTVSTAVDVLESLASTHEVPRLVLEYRQLTKLKSTYVDALPALLNSCTRRLHTTFDQTNTATGRLSSKNPNLQNIPIRTELGREIRAAFIAEPGHVLLSADYSQIELRLLAHFSEDALLVEAFRRGDDIHTITASKVFGVSPDQVTPEHRRRAKAVNFGIVYGQTPFGLSQTLGIEQKEARQFIDTYFAQYTGVRKWLDDIVDQARKEMRVTTMHGRVRPLPDMHSRNPALRGFAERTAMNTPLQGTAADLIKVAMIRLDRELPARGLESRMTLQVHDELVFEVPEAEVDTMRALVKEMMENVEPLRVPLLVEVGVGHNWRDLE
jgi:DNA polymerase-1